MSDTNASEVFNKLSTAEWIISAGAAWILVVVYFIGNRIQYEYFSSVQVIVAPLSLAVLLAIFVRHGGNESAWTKLYPGTVNLAGVVIVAFAVMDLFNGLANDFSESGEFYEITLYVAAAVIGGGLFQLRQESDSGEATSF